MSQEPAEWTGTGRDRRGRGGISTPKHSGRLRGKGAILLGVSHRPARVRFPPLPIEVARRLESNSLLKRRHGSHQGTKSVLVGPNLDQILQCIGGMGAVLRERAGAEGERRAADGCHEGCGPGWWRHGAAPWSTRRPSGLPRGRKQGRGRLWQRDCSRLNTTRAGVAPALQPAQAGRVGSDRCSRMARTALGAVRYANTRRLPPHQAQVKTSNAFRPAQQLRESPLAVSSPSLAPC